VNTFLLAEDNEANREYLTELFALRGYPLITVANGEEAIKTLDQQDFAVVLLDLQMPIKDGFEVLRHLRSSTVNRNTPAIALTAAAMEGDASKALSAGFDAYLTKPVSAKPLFSEIERLLQGRIKQ
jgi:CheY-like chemotaxis protein